MKTTKNKKIVFATLNRDRCSNIYWYENPEELEPARRYGGNINDFVCDYIICASLINYKSVRKVDDITVDNMPEGAVVLAYENEDPSIILWTE